ncbi:MAG: PQQ-dependent sugar dehydrogenase [Magnetococcales bacterium]|nr:PQQ-dependent sugar dehydrogenase [Magnetococcales bacterium]
MKFLKPTFILLFAINIYFISAINASTKEPFKIVTIASKLNHPWGMAFLPNGDILITQRPGQLRIVRNGILDPHPISGLPSNIVARGQGGLLDVALHPQYKKNGWIYLSFSAKGAGGIGTEVARGKLVGNRFTSVEKIFVLQPKSRAGQHFGSRMVFDNDNHIYISVGDRGDRPRVQNIDDPAGSIIRLKDDGSLVKDNRWYSRNSDAKMVYSYGHRNPQGMFFDSKTNTLWEHEHGPRGGDELNIIHKGKNYGWPVISHGVEYVSRFKIGEGNHKKGMEQPIHYWVPSIAPSGMTVYRGDKFPDWDGDILIGALKYQLLVRLKMDGTKVLKEERYLEQKIGRIRDVRTGPDGYIYLLTDKRDGQLVRLEPR